MTIEVKVIKKSDVVEPTVFITESDLNLIRSIRYRIGLVDAVKVLQLMTGQSLHTCVGFVRELQP